MSGVIRGLFAFGLLLVSCCSVFAADNDKVILTISGKIVKGPEINLTIAQLEALGSATIKTTTPWHDGAVTFEGVPMAALMTYAGAQGQTADVVALNNYRSSIPLSDFQQYGVILAIRKNGELMPVSDKGPLFIVYPFDQHPELQSEVYYSRSAWQVRKIVIE